MKNLNEITAEEIVLGMGISIDYLGIDLVFGRDEEAKSELRELAERESSIELKIPFSEETVKIDGISKTEEYAKIFKKHEDSVNKQNLVAYSLYYTKKDIEGKKLSEKQKRDYEAAMRKYIQLLGKRNFNMIYFGQTTDEQSIKPIRVINSQKLIECVKSGRSTQTLFTPSKKKMDKIQNIDKPLGLYLLVHVLTSNDIKSIVTYGNDVAKFINRSILTRCFELQNKGKELTDESVEDIGRIIADVLVTNCKYISVNKLYLMISYRLIEKLETGLDIDPKIYYSIILLLSQYIDKGTSIEIRQREESLQDVYSDEDKIIGQYSLNDLAKDMKRFVGDRFIRKSEIEGTKKDILEGEKTLRTADPAVMEFLEFNNSEKEILIKASEDNIIFALEKGIIDHSSLSYALSVRGRCSDKLLSMMIEKGFADGQGVLNLYYKGLISLENIKAILGAKKDNKETEKIPTVEPEFISRDDINQLIREIHSKITDNENKDSLQDLQAFYKLIDLYKLLSMDGKSEEEIEKASNSLIESFGDDLNSEIIEELYQYGLIRLKDAASWEINLNKMLLQGEIKPIDLKNLYSEGTIRLEDIKNVLRGNSMNYADKMWLIYSTFDGESKEEYDIRDELIQLLDTEGEYREEGKKIKSKEIEPDDKDKEKRTRWREYVSDPHARWKLISLLDKDYSRAVFPEGMAVLDGHTIFLLPNSKKVVIEKMLEKKGGRQVSSYAAATYILDKDVFYKFLVAIVEEGKVIRSTLGDLARNGYATKIIHNKSWGENIKKYFGIDEENERYSKEEIAQIDTAIENVEKSKQERE